MKRPGICPVKGCPCLLTDGRPFCRRHARRVPMDLLAQVHRAWHATVDAGGLEKLVAFEAWNRSVETASRALERHS